MNEAAIDQTKQKHQCLFQTRLSLSLYYYKIRHSMFAVTSDSHPTGSSPLINFLLCFYLFTDLSKPSSLYIIDLYILHYSVSDQMGQFISLVVLLSLSFGFCLLPLTASALRQNYYAKTCHNVENIVRAAVTKKFRQTFVTAPATIRLFFHDCFVKGCDASVMIASSGGKKAEKDHPDNLSLAGDGFDTVIKAKEALDAVPSCRNKVSCADILAMATRDVIALSGGPSYAVELGRLDGLSSTAASVNGRLPQPFFNLKQLNSLFAANGLTQADMIALSAAHTVGFAHCGKFANRIYNFSRRSAVDPVLNQAYATQLKQMCPRHVDPRIAINMDPNTPRKFDNVYFKNLQKGQGLFTSDQVLFTDPRSKPTVNAWATNSQAFNKAFIHAITKLGRVGVKTGKNGNIRRNCAAFN